MEDEFVVQIWFLETLPIEVGIASTLSEAAMLAAKALYEKTINLRTRDIFFYVFQREKNTEQPLDIAGKVLLTENSIYAIWGSLEFQRYFDLAIQQLEAKDGSLYNL